MDEELMSTALLLFTTAVLLVLDLNLCTLFDGSGFLRGYYFF
jgi:hypothetical protein